MSWLQNVKKELEPLEVSFEDTRRGNLVVKSLKHPQMTLIILVRRIQFSLDRKFEMVGVLQIPESRLEKQDRSQLLRRMLAESVELELKGALRRSLKVSRWSGLSSLAGITVPEETSLLSMLRSKEVEEVVKRGGIELVEIFPSLIPSELLEPYLMISDGDRMVGNIVKKHIESPQSISWIVRTHMLYGLQLGAGGIRRAFLTVIDLLKKIEEYTYTSLLQ